MSEIFPDVFTRYFNRLIAVTETGRPDSWEQQFNNGLEAKLFRTKYVKLGDGYLATAEDITQEKEAQRRIEESKALLEAVFKAAPVIISTFKSIRTHEGSIIDFEFIQTNQVTNSIQGGGPAGASLLQTYPFIQQPNVMNQLINVVETGEPLTTENYFPEIDKWYYSKLIKLDDGFLSTALDITQLKQTQQKLEQSECFVNSIIDSTPETILLFDIQGKCSIYANQHVTRLLGYSPEEILALGDRVLKTCIHPDDYEEQVNELLNCCHNSEDEVHTTEFRVIHKSGATRWVEARRSVFKCDPAGKPVQLIAILNDITRQKMAEDILEHKTAAAAR